LELGYRVVEPELLKLETDEMNAAFEGLTPEVISSVFWAVRPLPHEQHLLLEICDK
jgi:hypothetical protein